jgi:pentatricopeptide repeat protein
MFLQRRLVSYPTHVLNGLIDSYWKCDHLIVANRVFEEHCSDDIISFTSMITALSQCDRGEDAIKLFVQMLRKGLEPDPFVLCSLLNACASLSAYEPMCLLGMPLYTLMQSVVA